MKSKTIFHWLSNKIMFNKDKNYNQKSANNYSEILLFLIVVFFLFAYLDNNYQ